jgi:hypothetical protein
MTHHGNFYSIFTGAFFGVLNATLSISAGSGIEVLKVFVFGIIGGIGGWFGRLIIQQISKKFRK